MFNNFWWLLIYGLGKKQSLLRRTVSEQPPQSRLEGRFLFFGIDKF
jgi:hypothetical protein